jgi:DNA mismatch repair protein MutS
MPNNIVIRANELMHHLEKDQIREKNTERLQELPKNNFQLKLFEAGHPNFERIKELLAVLDINTISPVEALLKLNELKMLFQEKKTD